MYNVYIECPQFNNQTCGGNGVCMEDGRCECYVNFAGESCEYSSEECFNRGIVFSDGSCICDHGWNPGTKCDSCAEHFYPPGECSIECYDDVNCNDQGACSINGTCTCQPQFAGAACDQCAPDHHDYPACICEFLETSIFLN